MNEIVQIRFHGGQIEAVQQGETIWVSVRRVCEELGLAPNGQIVKLKEKEWACSKMFLSHDTTGRKQEQFFIHVDSLPMWMATIDTNRVIPELKPMLVAYQKEAAQVLKNHFIRQHHDIPKDYPSALRAAADAHEKLFEAKKQITQMQPYALYGESISHARGHRSIGEFAQSVRVNGVIMGQNRMFKVLYKLRVLIEKGKRRRSPYQRYYEEGWFVVQTGDHDENGKTVFHSTTRITPLGEICVVGRMAGMPEFQCSLITHDGKRVPAQLNINTRVG